MHRGKVDPGVSELPLGNELSRDHVNRPLDTHLFTFDYSLRSLIIHNRLIHLLVLS